MIKNLRTSIVTPLLMLSAIVVAQTPVPRHIERSIATAPAESAVSIKKMPLRAESTTVTADFSITGASSAQTAVYVQKFDSGLGDWSTDPAADVYWTVKKMYPNDAARNFSAIDPEDASSLFVEGPYQVYKRAKSSATSPSFNIPANSTLSFYTGFSKNYDDECRLFLYVVDGGEETEIWNSSEAPGEKPWAWRLIELPLDNYSGKTVSFKFTYGPGGKDSFNTGGYLGDFAIDNFSVNTVTSVDHIDVMTGETIALADLSTGPVASWQWTMPGAVPSTSTEQAPVIYYTKDGIYDITLLVTDAEGNTSEKTRSGFVTVTGDAPVAKILPPATFRLSSTRKPLVAPLAKITYADASINFPDSWDWTFTGVDSEPNGIFTSTEEAPTVSYSFMHDQAVGLTVSNSYGSSTDFCDVSVEYNGVINNMHPEDNAIVFDMEDWGVFPGSNTRKITAYAERFSAPSVPAVLDGVYVYFNKAQTTELVEQLANIGVHLYTSENGLPGQRIESWWWCAYELDLSGDGSLIGTAFPFTSCPVVDSEFFIVVDGLPEFNEGCCVSFAMAGFRDSDNTAYMLKDDKWMPVPEYFGAGHHTSYMIYPSLCHSVMSPLPVGSDGVVNVDASAGIAEFEIFSVRGYDTPVATDAPWLRVIGEPNGMTVDTIKVEYDAKPAGVAERTGHITLTDGATSLTLTLVQSGETTLQTISVDEGTAEYFDLTGRRVADPGKGVYIRRTAAGVTKVIK